MAEIVYAVEQSGAGVPSNGGSAHTTIQAALDQILTDFGASLFVDPVVVEVQDSPAVAYNEALVASVTLQPTTTNRLILRSAVGTRNTVIRTVANSMFFMNNRAMLIKNMIFDGNSIGNSGLVLFTNSIVEDCEFRGITSAGVVMAGGICRVTRSVFKNCGRAVEANLAGSGSSITNNFFIGNTTGLLGASVNTIIEHNSFHDNDVAFTQVGVAATVNRNNIYSVLAAQAAYQTAGADPSATAAFSNSDFNTFFIAGAGDLAIGSSTFATLAAWQSASGDARDDNSISADPLFVNIPTNDLRIVNASPCVEQGTPTAEILDIDQNQRDAVTPDMGAFEAALRSLPSRGSNQFPLSGANTPTLTPTLAWYLGPDLREGGTAQVRLTISETNLFESEADLTIPVARFESWATGESFGSALVSRGVGTYNLSGGETLTVKVNGAAATTVNFVGGDFSVGGAATAAEVAARIATDLAAAGGNAQESPNEPGKVQIFRTAGQDAGSLEVTGGTSNSVLGFDTYIHQNTPFLYTAPFDFTPYADPASVGTFSAMGTDDPSSIGTPGTDGADASSKEFIENGVTDGVAAKITSVTGRFITRGVLSGDVVVIFDIATQTSLGAFTVLSNPTSENELLLSGTPVAGTGLTCIVEPVACRYVAPTLQANVQFFWKAESWTGEVV